MRLIYPTFWARRRSNLVGTEILIKPLAIPISIINVVDAKVLGNKHAKWNIYNALDQAAKRESLLRFGLQPVISWIIEWVRKYMWSISLSYC